MKILHPRLPVEFTTLDDLGQTLLDSYKQETPVCTCTAQKQSLVQSHLPGLDVRQCRFEGCDFSECDFERASFLDTTFVNCNFSGCRFGESFFQRCRFVSCKCTGMDLRESVLKQILFEDCLLRYACLDGARVTDMGFLRVDFSDASMSETKLKGFMADDSTFVHNNFFQTPLTGVDFSTSLFSVPMLSSPPAELRGAKINVLQAAELITLWGLIVEN